MEPKKEQISRKAASSAQDKTGVFKRIKAYSKPIAKAVGTLVAASAIAWTLNTGKAVAQDYTVVSDSKNKTENIIEGPTIYGTKTFAVKYERGVLYFDSVRVDEKHFGKFEITVKTAEDAGIANYTNQDVQAVYYTKLEGQGDAAYLVFEHGILAAIPKATLTKGGADYSFVGSLIDKLFRHEGAIFIAPNGSILASTPTTLMLITPETTICYTYKEIFGQEMKNMITPIFSKGKSTDYVDMRDETLRYENTAYKLEILVNKNFTIEGVEDKAPIGGGN